MYLPSLRTVFIHAQKTGGTAISWAFIRSGLTEATIVDQKMPGKEEFTFEILENSSSGKHTTLRGYKRAIPTAAIEWALVVWRHPADRLVSRYLYSLRARGVNDSSFRPGYREFMRTIRETRSIIQSLALESVDPHLTYFVVDFEHIEGGLMAFFEKFDGVDAELVLANFQRINKNPWGLSIRRSWRGKALLMVSRILVSITHHRKDLRIRPKGPFLELSGEELFGRSK